LESDYEFIFIILLAIFPFQGKIASGSEERPRGTQVLVLVLVT